LAEVGWSRCTVAVVAERAEVSRGAAQHHFPTREALITAAVDHMTDVRAAEIRRNVESWPAEALTTHAIVELIVAIYTGTLFRASLELWVASSADPQLRALVVPLEARIGREVHQATVDLLGVDESVPGTRELIQATLDLARGLGLANLLTDDSRRRGPIVAQWAHVLDQTLDR
jgi:AcrR family transcriptional regulator